MSHQSIHRVVGAPGALESGSAPAAGRRLTAGDGANRLNTADGPAAAYSPSLHAMAWGVLLLAFPLIFMGGLVTSRGAGLSVPDWPNSFGYNMFLFPPSQWVGGIWYEHVHRLLGTAVGFAALSFTLLAWGPASGAGARRRIGIATLASLAATGACVGYVLVLRAGGGWETEAGFWKWFQHVIVGFGSLALVGMVAYVARRREPRRWLRWTAVGLLVAVCVQGILGGQRVDLVSLTLAIFHGCFAHCFFAFSAGVVLFTSKWWVLGRGVSPSIADQKGTKSDRTRFGPGLRLGVGSGSGGESGSGRVGGLGPVVWLGGFAMACIVTQLAVGATMRHLGAGLAIPDLPLAYGHLLPPTNSVQLAAANAQRAWVEHLPPTDLAGIWLHFAHRVGAVVVTCVLGGLILISYRRTRHLDRGTARAALAVAGLVSAQFTLGVLTVYLRKPADIASLHVATGALLLMTTVVLTTRVARLHWLLAAATAPVTAARAFGAGPRVMGVDQASSSQRGETADAGKITSREAPTSLNPPGSVAAGQVGAHPAPQPELITTRLATPVEQ